MMVQYLEQINEKYQAIVEKMNKLPLLKTFFSTIRKEKLNKAKFV